MKNQYFGDNRDLFKYDLICKIVQARRAGLPNQFTFIPMLTKNDSTGQGGETVRNKAKAGTNNQELVSFLDKCLKQGKRNIKQLEGFLTHKLSIYEKGKYFSHEKRREYFKQIGDKFLSKSLVLVDPDIGLEVKRTRDKHMKYTEVKNLYQRMDKSSILMIFQYIPRENRENCFREKSEKLKREVGSLPIYISDNQIAFFFLTKENELLKESLGKEISKYGKAYGLRVGVT